MKIIDYNNGLKYLPDFMKDFHDQKDLFKCIHDLYKDDENFKELPASWRDNHIFVIDFFLWFMSMHGYKLQKIRQNIQFCDLHETMNEFKRKRLKQTINILSEKLPADGGE